MHPESHIRYHSERHADLLRQARKIDLAAKLGETRLLRRSLSLWRRRYAGQLTLGRA